MNITEADNIINIWLMRLRRQRIAQENQQIDLIVFDLCAELLGTSQMTRQIFMEGQIRNLLNQAACRSCRIEFIPFLQKYQAQRIMGKIFHSSSEFTDLNRQQDNSMMAIGSGQLRGKGLFNNTLSSVKNGNFLSEEQTDFIFAVIGEELGFVGGVAVIALYALLVYECLWIAARAKDTAGRLIASGMAALLAFQSFANIAVATGIFPNTGLPLPFISSGLSSLLSMFIGMGVVLNVGLQRNNVTVQ